MTLAHTAETIAAYASSVLIMRYRQLCQIKGVSGICKKASNCQPMQKWYQTYLHEPNGLDFPHQQYTIDITDETDLKIYVANAGAYEAMQRPLLCI